ncbi:MAG: hypothetical protein JWM27_3963 [Gemmatimonadetes bacterium]|nr:hypothetical protein [Gemmatimonadota bacterium]
MRSACALLLLLLAAGCDRADSGAPLVPRPAPVSDRWYAAPGRVWTPDDEMARIAREEVPGFGGWYVDGQGRATARLKDVRGRAGAVLALRRSLAAARFADGRGPSFDGMQVAAARYGFDELQAWRLALRGPVFDDRRTSFLDIDETRNRIVIGVADGAAGGRMLAAAARLHVPPDAVATQLTPIACALAAGCPPPDGSGTGGGTASPGQPDQDLVNNRPGYLDGEAGTIIAGYQVYHDRDPATGQASVCTLGVNAQVDFSNGTLDGFFTASHCTQKLFASDGTEFFQGAQDAGYEGWDRGTFDYDATTACWIQQRCRWSDAAFVKYNTGVAWQRGYVARATSRSVFGGAVRTVGGRYTINGYYSPPVAPPYFGQQLVKVGRTTGETAGRVVQTCIDVPNSFQSRWMTQPVAYRLLCQYQVDSTWADEGDSGAPVFAVQSGTDVWLYGLLWGQPNGLHNTYYFSGWYETVWGDMQTYPLFVRIRP